MIIANGEFLERNGSPGQAPAAESGSAQHGQIWQILGAGSGRATILLVEDDAALRELLGELLAEAGYRVLDAPTPDDALALVRTHAGPVHLLLTDVVMPGLSGLALAQRIKAQRSETRVLYMSGHTHETIEQHGCLDPDAPLVQKPFLAETLLARIRDTLGRAVTARAARGSR